MELHITKSITFTARARAVVRQELFPAEVLAKLPEFVVGDVIKAYPVADCWMVVLERQFEIHSNTSATIRWVLDLAEHPEPTLIV